VKGLEHLLGEALGALRATFTAVLSGSDAPARTSVAVTAVVIVIIAPVLAKLVSKTGRS